MSRRQSAPKPEELIQKLDDKVLSIKQEIESIIEELKNDVNVKSSEIEENKRIHTEGISELQASLKKLKEEFKEDGKNIGKVSLLERFVLVKSNREESNEQTNSLKEEVIERLEKTRHQIDQVEGKTIDSISEVYENISSSEEKHTASIAELSDSIVVGI